MKPIKQLIKKSDAYKALEKKQTISKQVNNIKILSDQIYEERSVKFYEPVWFEIQKGDNPDIWEDHLHYLGIDNDVNPKTDTVILKVMGYVEHSTNY